MTHIAYISVQFSSVQSLSHVRLFVTPWTTAHQASLSNTNSQSLPKLKSIESVMPSNHLILCHPHLLLPSIFPSIRIFLNESALHIRWPKYWHFSCNISPSNEHPGLISFRMDWLDLLAVQGKNTAVGCHSLLQEIFPTKRLNSGLLHCKQILYYVSHQKDSTTIKHEFCFVFFAEDTDIETKGLWF